MKEQKPVEKECGNLIPLGSKHGKCPACGKDVKDHKQRALKREHIDHVTNWRQGWS